MIELHTPNGVINVDLATITDVELATLGLTRQWADKECYQQQIAKDSNDNIHFIKLAYDNWDSLSATQKRETIKHLLVCMLNLYRGQY